MSEMPPSAALRAAMDELQAGNGAKGEEILILAVREAEAAHGKDSNEHAAALFDAGRFFATIGDFRRAAGIIRQAADLELPGEAGMKDRLTYLRNVGEMLRYAGDLEGAESVLREGLEKRRTFYGETHAGYAFGLEPLAEVIWLRGRPADALEVIKEAVKKLWDDGNPQVLSALALRTFIHHAADAEGGAFEDLPRMADEDVDAITQSVLFRAEHVPDGTSTIPAIDDLADWLGALRGETHPSLIPVIAKMADQARIVGDSVERESTLERLVGLCRANDDENQAIKALQALAIAQDEHGRPAEAEATYQRALDSANTYGDPERLSSVQRNFGLFYKEKEDKARAEDLLRKAVAAGQRAQDPDALGRGLVALGILIQHDGRLEEARTLLEQAIATLPPAHPDLLYARSHHNAIVTGGSCGCGNMGAAFSETLRALVLPSLPPDLLEDVDISDDGNVNVRLSRAPTEEEQEILQRVLNHALREIRSRIDQQGYS